MTNDIFLNLTKESRDSKRSYLLYDIKEMLNCARELISSHKLNATQCAKIFKDCIINSSLSETERNRTIKNIFNRNRGVYWILKIDDELFEELHKNLDSLLVNETFINPLFRSFFINDESYFNAITELVNAKFINSGSLAFIDEKNGNKSSFIQILKSFQSKGFYKKMPSSLEFVKIALEVFRVDISLDTIKHTKGV